MKRKKHKIIPATMVILMVFCFSSLLSAQYSEIVKPVSPESLAKAQQILKPPVTLLSFRHINPENCYLPTLGAFCKLENRLEKKARIPVKMRLGSVDYVNKLEQKGH